LLYIFRLYLVMPVMLVVLGSIPQPIIYSQELRAVPYTIGIFKLKKQPT
jgi:hypothetical protein